MPSLRAAQAFNAEFSPTHVPVALFIGGTSGIGQAIAEKLAFHTKGNAHIFIIGRNRVAGEKTISKFPRPSLPNIVHEFISCDATLIANVNAVTKDILARFNKVNFLVMSSGGFPTTMGRDETTEGIDRPLALHYYSRWKLITDCLPALMRAQQEGGMAKIFSVLGPGRGHEIDLDDLGLHKHYSFLREARQALMYQDIMVEDFAARYPNLSVCHVHPGPVATNLFRASGAQWCNSGEYLLYGMLNSGKGVQRIGPKGDEMSKLKDRVFGSEEARKKLWDHTVEVMSAIRDPGRLRDEQ